MSTATAYRTEQEAFWAGDFGTDYIDRNASDQLLASNLNFFSQCLRVAERPANCIEFGANIGMNLRALKALYPGLDTHAVEINADAAGELRKLTAPANVHEGSILEFDPPRAYDLVLIKGVLIHINPDELSQVYAKLAQATGRYLLIAEYYNPSPVAIPYRGHSDRLFKRDFAGEVLDAHPDLKLRDYGFAYRRDPKFPQDDITWFLLEKKA